MTKPASVGLVTTRMDISLILCTHNRSSTLSRALQSVVASTIAERLEWEVLVVDNNSSDGTRGVSEEFIDRYPGRFRYLFEPRPGKSYALNKAIRNARGCI